MIELEKYFILRDRNSQQGFEYEQISSTDKAYIYKKRDLIFNRTSYLVFKRIEDNIIGRVKFPQDHDIGDWAFEYLILQSALARFKDLNYDYETKIV